MRRSSRSTNSRDWKLRSREASLQKIREKSPKIVPWARHIFQSLIASARPAFPAIVRDLSSHVIAWSLRLRLRLFRWASEFWIGREVALKIGNLLQCEVPVGKNGAKAPGSPVAEGTLGRIRHA